MGTSGDIYKASQKRHKNNKNKLNIKDTFGKERMRMNIIKIN